MRLAIAALLFTLPSSAASVLLTFEGVTGAPGNFYNGGAGGNFGITFSANAGAIISNAVANEPSPVTVLTWNTSSTITVNVASGFQSIFRTGVNAADAYSASVYSGLNGTGSLLGSFSSASGTGPFGTGTGCGAGALNCWTTESVNFSGVAQSVVLTGTSLYDDMFVGNIPEPGSLALAALGLAALIRYRRR